MRRRGRGPSDRSSDQLSLLNYYGIENDDLGTTAAAHAVHPLARTFLPIARPVVSRALSHDLSGRIAQFLEICPGAFVFLAGVERLQARAEAEMVLRQFLGAVRRGEPLRQILKTLVDAWIHYLYSPSCALEVWRPYNAILTAPRTELAALRETQVLLLRKASSLVEPRWLLAAPIHTAVLEDIPRDPVDNATWFRGAHQVALMVRHMPAGAALVSRYLSKHFVALKARCTDGAAFDRLIRRFGSYCMMTGYEPKRAARLEPLLQELDRNNQAIDRFVIYNLEPEQLADSKHGLATAVQTLPPPLLDHPKMTVIPLTTPRMLVEEGTAMGHCVGTMDGLLHDKQARFYSIRIGTRRLTAYIRRGRVGWKVSTLRGAENRMPERCERKAVLFWLNGLFDSPRVLAQAPSTAHPRSTSNSPPEGTVAKQFIDPGALRFVERLRELNPTSAQHLLRLLQGDPDPRRAGLPESAPA